MRDGHGLVTRRALRAEGVGRSSVRNLVATGRWEEVTSLVAFLGALGRRGRNGTAGLRRYVEARGAGYTPAASGVESRTQQVLNDAGIDVRRQVDVGGDRRWTGRVDFVVVGRHVVIEVQSERHHSALVDVAAAAVRIAGLRAAGWTVVEVTDTVVWTQPGVLVEKVREAVRRT
jgi:very-short-patch-repair endonuclease